MTHSGGQPHITGDKGQRYEVSYYDPDTKTRKVFGWAEKYSGAMSMENAIKLHPSMQDPAIDDRMPGRGTHTSHELYTLADFSIAEVSSGSELAKRVIDGGLDICKKCGGAESELESPCGAQPSVPEVAITVDRPGRILLHNMPECPICRKRIPATEQAVVIKSSGFKTLAHITCADE